MKFQMSTSVGWTKEAVNTSVSTKPDHTTVPVQKALLSIAEITDHVLQVIN